MKVFVAEGQTVTAGTPLLQVDDSVQKATAEQQKSQSDAARAMLDELRAEPRKENLEVARAQVELAQANLKSAEDQFDKQQRSYNLAPESISRDAFDNASNARRVAKANLDVVTRQYELTKAGAWAFDIKNQEKQVEALSKAYAASAALLAKYTIKAPSDGTILSINATVGSYVSPQGAYQTYTQSFGPVVVMGTSRDTLAVRCYVDEILIPRLPPEDKLKAEMFMLTSNAIDAAITQAAYEAEIENAKEIVGLLRDQARIAGLQAAAGTVPVASALGLESQAASIEATIPGLEEKIDQATHLLAALVGTTPANWTLPPLRLSDFRTPRELPLAVPSSLVRRRPDILIAEATLHAATANIGVATAAMLPNLTLSATYGANSRTPDGLFGAGSPFWNFGAGLTQPVFHGGALHYQKKAAVDACAAAAAEYRQAVLAAFQEVADTLRGLTHDADTIAAETEAVQTSEKALHLFQANYEAGLATYLQVIVADVQYLQAKTGYVQAIAQRLEDTVALYVSLGGGWWTVPAASRG